MRAVDGELHAGFLSDELQWFLEDINKNSSASKLFSSHKATRNKIRGAFIVSINGTQVFNKSSAITLLADLHSQGIKTFDIQFAPEHKMSSQQQWKQLDELCQQHKVDWNWVKGHAGNVGNERVDELARSAMEPYKENDGP